MIKQDLTKKKIGRKLKSFLTFKMQKYQIFGSKTSQDYDILVFVDKLGTIDENHSYIKELNKEFSIKYPDKKINCNLGILKEGKILEVFKGTADEVNNSLFFTYKNHIQEYPNQISSLYPRYEQYYKDLKLKRCSRFILSFFSRTYLRTEIKEALRGNFLQRLAVLKTIDFNRLNTFPGKKDKPVDIYKTIAFQLGQTISLCKGTQLYSKEDIIECHPKLKSYLLREEVTDHSILNEYLEKFIEIGFEAVLTMNNLNEEILGQ